MSINQKLETSREIRQWVGIGISTISLVVGVWYLVDPEGLKRTVNKFTNKLRRR